MEKLSGAVKTILECIGEDPEREGLLRTPERFAKAMLFFTKGYEVNVFDTMNEAIFNEGCKHKSDSVNNCSDYKD
jgi:GTP cyclohydrolase I